MNVTGSRPRTADVVAVVILLFVTVALYVPVTARAVEHRSPGDFANHLALVPRIAAGHLPSAHPLFHLLVWGAHRLVPSSTLSGAAIGVTTAAHFAFGLVLYLGLFRSLGTAGTAAGAARRLLATLAAMIAYDVPALFPYDRHSYFGYLGLTEYHNPTMAVLRPIAAIQFLLLGLSLDAPFSRRRTALLAVSTVLSALAKPSYLICLLPASVLLLVDGPASRRRSRAATVLGGLWLPALPLLLLQLSSEWGPAPAPVRFAPFLVVLHDSRPWTLLPKIGLGLLFPLSATWALRKETARDSLLRLAWASLLAAVAIGYLLADPPPWTFHGNFLWGLESCGSLLFAATLRLFGTNAGFRGAPSVPPGPHRADAARRDALPAFFLLLHVLSGLAWYLLNLLAAEPMDLW